MKSPTARELQVPQATRREDIFCLLYTNCAGIDFIFIFSSNQVRVAINNTSSDQQHEGRAALRNGFSKGFNDRLIDIHQ